MPADSCLCSFLRPGTPELPLAELNDYIFTEYLHVTGVLS